MRDSMRDSTHFMDNSRKASPPRSTLDLVVPIGHQLSGSSLSVRDDEISFPGMQGLNPNGIEFNFGVDQVIQCFALGHGII